jgi:predicted AAA+ superfamily ATPase
VKNVWENCTFSDEIISGDLKQHKFAVELHEFLKNTADPVYQDPALFFENTYLTNQMQGMLKDTLLRLDRNEGVPVTVIDTGFGGGKTHTLLLMHHIFKNPSIGFEYISKFNLDKENNIQKIPDVNVIAIDCRDVEKNTLWGEIADRLGKYEQFKEYDEKRKPVNNLDDLKSLFDKPTLLMIDELPHYLLECAHEKVGDVFLHKLTNAFVTKLISVFSGLKNCCLILTLTATQQMYSEYTAEIKDGIRKIDDYYAEEINSDLRQAISRQPQIVTPVEKNQIYDVVRTRLIRKILNEKDRDTVVSTFYQYYAEKSIVIEPNYEEKMKKAYPFHPFLIDTLYDRVKTIPEFNQTRGMLRLLGLILRKIYETKSECKLVSTADIPLDDHTVADELTAKINKNLRHVIDTDCVEHSREYDAQKSIKIVESISRTIFLYSLHNENAKSGIKRNQIRLAVCTPGMDPNLVDRVLEEDIEKNFWYIQTKDLQEFYFVEQANVNAIIHEHKKDVTDNDIRRELEKTLNIMLKETKFKSIIWDEHDLLDNDELKIFAVDYKKNLSDESVAKSYVSQNLEHLSTGGIREKQNTIVFVYPDQDALKLLLAKTIWSVAIQSARKDERVQATKEFEDKIKTRESDAKLSLEKECFATYCKIAYPNGAEPRFDVIYHMDTSSETISGAILEVLKKKGKLIDVLGVDGIPNVTEPTLISKIYKGFKVNKSNKFLQETGSIQDAISEGITQERYGYAEKLVEIDGKFEATIGRSGIISWEGYLIPKDQIFSKEIIEESSHESRTMDETETLQTMLEYRLPCDDVNMIITNIGILTILAVDNKNLKKSLHADLKLGDGTTITIDSDLKNHNDVKSMLSAIKSQITGNGYLTIKSEIDLQKELNDLDVKFNLI